MAVVVVAAAAAAMVTVVVVVVFLVVGCLRVLLPPVLVPTVEGRPLATAPTATAAAASTPAPDAAEVRAGGGGSPGAALGAAGGGGGGRERIGAVVETEPPLAADGAVEEGRRAEGLQALGGLLASARRTALLMPIADRWAGAIAAAGLAPGLGAALRALLPYGDRQGEDDYIQV